MNILGGTLAPVLASEQTLDLVYGADFNGVYLGLVIAANAPLIADRAPPKSGDWRWNGTDWVPFVDLPTRTAAIDQQLDERLNAGVVLGGSVRYYTDPTFSMHLTAFLQAFSSGILPADATVGIRGMDKVVYQVTNGQLKTIAAGVMAYVQAQYAWAWAEKAKLGS